MINQWFQKILTGVFVGLLLAGCGASGTQTQPVEPSPPPAPAAGTTEAPREEPVAPPAFDPNGNPYVPGSNRLLSRVFYFDYDRAVLSPDDLASLEMHATVLRNNRDRSVVIEGHCDERGTREYNLALGERRADAIRGFLISAGVGGGQIESVSYGEERPEDPGHTEAAWSRNRRGVLVYR
jgi:peptidoglycan-associated lipoprotein